RVRELLPPRGGARSRPRAPGREHPHAAGDPPVSRRAPRAALRLVPRGAVAAGVAVGRRRSHRDALAAAGRLLEAARVARLAGGRLGGGPAPTAGDRAGARSDGRRSRAPSLTGRFALAPGLLPRSGAMTDRTNSRDPKRENRDPLTNEPGSH